MIHRFVLTSSTQDEARRLFSTGRGKIGHIVVADEQTAGRGRFGRTWLSPSGGLYATYIVAPDSHVALRSGVAVVRALARHGIEAGLKWPNDVLLGEGKLAGILIEAFEECSMIGIGINLTTAPIARAASLDRAGAPVGRAELMLAIWDELHGPLTEDELLKAYRENCVTLGKRVRATFEGQRKPQVGVAVEVDAEGRLGVRTDSRISWVSSGECEHLYNGSEPEESMDR